MKKLIFAFVTILLLFIFAIITFSQKTDVAMAQTDTKMESVTYTLPYPGLLPDNPLYYLKKVRDNFWFFFTRDNIKKAEVLLLFSDRKVASAQTLAEKNSWDKSSAIMLEAEQNFERMLEMIVLSKSQGVSPDPGLIEKIKLSNKKHKEAIKDLLIKTPQDSQKELQNALELNEKLAEKLLETL